MIVIISPAKRVKPDPDFMPYQMPVFISHAKLLCKELQKLTYEKLRKVLSCNDRIANDAFNIYQDMNLEKNTTPAIVSFDGIQFKCMAPRVFDTECFNYIEEHVKILSALYGILNPFDGIVPYRLELCANFSFLHYKNLYDFWGDLPAIKINNETDIVLNLASNEYAKMICPHLKKQIRIIHFVFAQNISGKIIEKGVYVKIARGEMVRFLAENKITDYRDTKYFNRGGYRYEKDLSSENKYVFIKDS